jgi:glutamate decarboxylase
MSLSDAVATMGPFELLSDGSDIPVFAFAVRDPSKYTVFDVSNRMRQYGWQLPAYTMPADAEDLAVLRLVVREGFSADLGDKLLADLGEVVAHLEKHGRPPGEDAPVPFAHT